MCNEVHFDLDERTGTNYNSTVSTCQHFWSCHNCSVRHDFVLSASVRLRPQSLLTDRHTRTRQWIGQTRSKRNWHFTHSLKEIPTTLLINSFDLYLPRISSRSVQDSRFVAKQKTQEEPTWDGVGHHEPDEPIFDVRNRKKSRHSLANHLLKKGTWFQCGTANFRKHVKVFHLPGEPVTSSETTRGYWTCLHTRDEVPTEISSELRHWNLQKSKNFCQCRILQTHHERLTSIYTGGHQTRNSVRTCRLQVVIPLTLRLYSIGGYQYFVHRLSRPWTRVRGLGLSVGGLGVGDVTTGISKQHF